MTTTTATATFTKLNGEWMIRVPKDMWEEGATITVTLKNGGSKNVICGDWFEDDDDAYIAAFTDPTPKAPARKATRKRAARPATGWSRYRTRAPRQCPTCGEEEGGLYNHGRCDECGYHAH